MVVHVCNDLSISEAGQLCEFEASLVKTQKTKKESVFFFNCFNSFVIGYATLFIHWSGLPSSSL